MLLLLLRRLGGLRLRLRGMDRERVTIVTLVCAVPVSGGKDGGWKFSGSEKSRK